MTPTDIDRTAVLAVIALDDAAQAAAAQRDGTRAIPRYIPLDGPDMVPARLAPEQQLVHDGIAALDAAEQAQLLALYFLGRQAGWEGLGHSAFPDMLAHAESNLDDVPWYLSVKPDLGPALRQALTILAA